ncbi:hypothetical protein [Arthrobacter cavernae]|uniref:hypothetical protein n=1 Tax=Arthrobacter cavernae TaxID=2817681 RepID=UPI001F61BB84|nr:hypothetical protein [Arthrobacter cavernae]
MAQKEHEPLGISVTVIEPGGFRTDFAGRSLTESAEPIADYAEGRRPAAQRARQGPGFDA